MRLTRLVFSLILFGLAALNAAAFAAPAAPSLAVFYGDRPPVDLLAQFDWVVIEAENVDAGQLARVQAHGAQAFAYVSLGEAERWRPGYGTIDKHAIRTQNPAWNSDVVDLADPSWREYVLQQRITPLWQQGYRGVFLDTLDSFHLFTNDEPEIARQRTALISLIKAIHDRYPGLKLILNRGFEVLDAVHGDVAGVAAESLFKQWDPQRKQYLDVAESDRQALIAELKAAQDRYQLPVAVIDYLPPSQRELARDTARKIAALGFMPWVANAELDEMGVGSIEAMPRRVLILYQMDETGDDVAFSSAHLYAAMPLEYLGYTADYHEMGEPLPAGTLRGRYAGIVTWLESNVADEATYEKWLRKQIEDEVPLAILGDPGFAFDGSLLKKLGLKSSSAYAQKSLSVADHDGLVGFEGLPDIPPPGGSGFRAASPDVREHLLLQDAQGHGFAPILTGPWGGIALNPWIVQAAGSNGGIGEDAESRHERWLLDPFTFFRIALRLPIMPVPDTTTENGSRVLTGHIDGDGFANRAELPGSPFSGQIILDRVLRRYGLPTTVSVIEGEVAQDGLYPKLAPVLEPIAREIFRQPNVEIASHTYSHPFDWLEIKDGEASGKHNLPIPGYSFSMRKEIDGSVGYIDKTLAPPDKKTKMVLWSGDALPTQDALDRVHRLGLANMNGGFTDISLRNNSLTGVSPMVRPVKSDIQVYAPIINENVYTNGFKGPYWGFEHAIQTFELTDQPRRLKPMSIYYHFFSGTRHSSLNAIKRVYDYALSKPVLPMFESQYYAVVRNFGDVGVAQALDGSWRITGATDSRTLRLPAELGWPDFRKSSGVAGARELNQGRYVALTGADLVSLKLAGALPATPALESSNGRIAEWQQTANGVDLRLRAEVPLRVALSGVAPTCRINAPGAQIKRAEDRATLQYTRMDSGHVSIACR